MGGYFGKLNMYAGKFLSVNCKSKMHLYFDFVQYTEQVCMEENTKRHPDSILVYLNMPGLAILILWHS